MRKSPRNSKNEIRRSVSVCVCERERERYREAGDGAVTRAHDSLEAGTEREGERETRKKINTSNLQHQEEEDSVVITHLIHTHQLLQERVFYDRESNDDPWPRPGPTHWPLVGRGGGGGSV